MTADDEDMPAVIDLGEDRAVPDLAKMYFVSFSHVAVDGAGGHGNMPVRVEGGVTGIDVVLEITRAIESAGHRSVVVLFWREFEGQAPQ